MNADRLRDAITALTDSVHVIVSEAEEVLRQNRYHQIEIDQRLEASRLLLRTIDLLREENTRLRAFVAPLPDEKVKQS